MALRVKGSGKNTANETKSPEICIYSLFLAVFAPLLRRISASGSGILAGTDCCVGKGHPNLPANEPNFDFSKGNPVIAVKEDEFHLFLAPGTGVKPIMAVGDYDVSNFTNTSSPIAFLVPRVDMSTRLKDNMGLPGISHPSSNPLVLTELLGLIGGKNE